MSLYRDEGVVLRTQKLGEADRIVTVLTREHGRVRAVGEGCRRTRSKFGPGWSRSRHVDVQLYTGRSLDIVTQVESFDSYGADLAGDYARYTAGTAMLETAERLTDDEKEPAVQQYLLLVGGLRALARRRARRRPRARLVPAAVARGRRLRRRASTPAPGAALPGRTGAVASRRVARSAATCRPRAPRRSSPGDASTLLARCSPVTGTVADAAEPRHRREGSGLVAAYLQWHLERGLRSLRLVERS